MDLASWTASHQLSDAECARRLGVSKSAFGRYKAGQRMPRPAILVRIKELTGGAVTANDFLPEIEMRVAS